MSREGYTGFTRGEARTPIATSDLQFASLGPFAKLGRLPWGTILVICAMSLTGAAMLFSTAWDPATQAPNPAEADLWRNHLIRFAIGLVLMLVLALTPLKVWAALAFPAYFATLVLLIMVDQFGVAGGGAQRWIRIGGMMLQPSELAKLSVTMALARYYHSALSTNNQVPGLMTHFGALGIILIPAAFVFKQPDLGTTLALVASGCMLIFFAGLSLKIVGSVLALGIASVPALYLFVLAPYQRERVDTFLAGLTGEPTNGLGESYQIEQAKIAIGAGGIPGRGYLQGIQSQQDYVPEQHTDFILTVIAEEFGLIGATALLTAFAFLLVWSFLAALRCRSWFGRLAACGAASTVAFFAIFNISMVIGLLPVVGMPLPFISYGGTALLTVMACFGLIISAHVHQGEKLTAQGLI
jgi:rod shape determining protein RodA